MANRLTLRLVTPTHPVLEVDCDEVRAPGVQGNFGVRPGHEPFLTTLDSGPLHFFDEGRDDAYAVVGGFVEIRDDEVTVLADEAVHVEKIDPEHELAALEEARKRLCEVQEGLVQHRMESARVRRHAARLATVRL